MSDWESKIHMIALQNLGQDYTSSRIACSEMLRHSTVQDSMKYCTTSLVPRPLPVFNVARWKTGGPGRQNHVRAIALLRFYTFVLHSSIPYGAKWMCNRTHMILPPRPSRFSACNIEKLGVAWGWGYSTTVTIHALLSQLHTINHSAPIMYVPCQMSYEVGGEGKDMYTTTILLIWNSYCIT